MRTQVVAADSFSVSSDAEIEKALAMHVESVREAMGAGGGVAQIVTMVEANFGGWIGASRIATICSRFPPMIHMTQDRSAHKRIGVYTSAEVKERMRLALQALLRAEKVAFYARFRSQSVGARAELCCQLRRYQYCWREPSDHFGAGRRVLTGKTGGANDDLCIVMQMLAFWPEYAMRNKNCLVPLR